jgi:hypothetical protein
VDVIKFDRVRECFVRTGNYREIPGERLNSDRASEENAMIAARPSAEQAPSEEPSV